MDLPPEISRNNKRKIKDSISTDGEVNSRTVTVYSNFEEKTLVNHNKVKVRKGIKRKHNNESNEEYFYERNKRSKKMNQNKEQDPNLENSHRLSLSKRSRKDVEHIINVFISLFSEYLEVINPELLVVSVILQDPKLREPLRRALKIIMTCILKKDDLAKSLTEAINALGDSNVRNSLKYTKRELMQRSPTKLVKKVKVKVKNWDDVIVEELERQNLL